MDRPVGPALRWARAALLAVVAMVSGVLAHVGAGGLMPGRTAMVVLFVLCCAGAAAFLARPASTLRIVVLVVAGQTFIHGVLTAMVGHRGDPPLTRVAAPAPRLPVPVVPTPVTSGGHRVGSLADLSQAGRPPVGPPQLTIPAPVQHLLADFTGPHALMALAHLVAAVALGCWLARGERLLWDVLTLTACRITDLGAGTRRATRALYALATTPLPPRSSRPWSLPPAASAACARALAGTVVRRGPPARVPG